MGALAVVSTFLPFVVKGLEHLVKNKDGKKMGPVRMEVGIGIVHALVQQLAGIEGITQKPTDEEVRGALEATFQNMKAKGELTAEAQPSGAYYIVRGPIVALPAL